MSREARPKGRNRPVSRSLREYARGVAGGLLFSLPLLYTMEVWWAGFLARPPRLLLYFAAGFLLLFAYNRYSGLHEDASWREVAFEAVEEMGLGLLVSVLMLWLLGQLQAGMPLNEIVGKVVVEGVTAAIGVSVGSAQLAATARGMTARGCPARTRRTAWAGRPPSPRVGRSCSPATWRPRRRS